MSQSSHYLGEKPPYALDAHISCDWEVRANAIPVEDLLRAYASLHHTEMQALEWLTATNQAIGISYTYGLHPNAPSEAPYDSVPASPSIRELIHSRVCVYRVEWQ